MAEAYDHRSPKSRPPRPKVLDEIRVKRSANGGFIARHSFDNSGPGEGYHESEDHTFGEGEGQAMLAHVGKHMGISGKKAMEPMKKEAGEEAKD